jgi:NADH dehydrogenase
VTALLVTGAGGFVGRELLGHLAGAEFAAVRLLARMPDRLARRLPAGPWEIVAGDLRDPTTLPPALAGVETVLHLAATTGKASRRELFAVNAAGTRALVEAAERAGATRFILVSSIAAGFPDRRWYPYAEAKLEAEAAVKASRLDWMIVRPTMVFGPGSPVQAGLARLASAPVGLVSGSGRAPVQPIHVRDLARLLAAVLRRRPLGRLTVEGGGPEQIPLIELLRRLRKASRGSEGPFLHLPLQPLRLVLAAMEPFLLPLLPLTAGQLASFANPGTAAPVPSGIDWRAEIRLDAMLGNG